MGKSGRVAFTRDGVLSVTDEKGEHPRSLIGAKGFQVENAGAHLPSVESSGMGMLSFSPDESRVYFLKPGWATSMALFYVEVSTAKVFMFHDANDYTVIQECTDKKQIGRVITFEHSYFDVNPGSAVDLFFLVDGAEPKAHEDRIGKSGRLGIIGPTPKNMNRFLAKTCGQGKAPPDDSPKIPPSLAGSVIKCKTMSLKRLDMKLLDGTNQVRFTPTDPDGAGQVFDVEEAQLICSQTGNE